jgi:hypothetical protein
MSSAQINQVPTASAFTPLAVPGCALWLDGADQTTMTLNQSTMTNWRDKSGNGYMALSFSNSVSPPTWASNVQNGRGVVQYAVGNGSFVSSFTITPAMTVFALYYPIGQTTNSPPIEQSVNSALNPGFLLQAAANNFTIRGSIPGPANLVMSNVTMTWSAYAGAQTYTWTLYESTVGTTGPWTQINSAATASTSAAHTPMTIGNYYYFTVVVTTQTGVSPPNASTPAQLTSSALLSPTNLTLTIPAGTSATATMAWTGSAGATTYSWILYSSATAAYAGTLLTSGSTAGTSATYGITIGSYNYFSVRAVTSALISAAAFSAIVGEQIVPPTGLTISFTGTTITMSWTAYTAATSYAWTLYSNSIYAYSGAQVTTGTVTGSPPATTASYSSAVSGTYYYFTLTVTTPGGTGYTSGPATSSILQVAAATSIVASGGTQSTSPLGFTVYTFTTSATWTLTSPASFTAQVLVVGGGGAGDGGDSTGGGGAGAALYNSNFAITSGSYSVTVGIGGVVGIPSSNGASSIFSSLTAVGGGAGGSLSSSSGSNGGCGGGAGGFSGGSGGIGSVGGNGGTIFSPGYNAYGIVTGGGGGMGGNGGNGTSSGGGQGGAGKTFSLGGTSYLVAGGGGGEGTVVIDAPVINPGAGGSGIGGTGALAGPSGQRYPATQPVANTGSGGGGGNKTGAEASAGASGIVVVAIPPQVFTSPTNPTLTTSGTAATMSWTAVSGATGYSWTFYQSATNAYAGTSSATGTTTSALTASVSSGLSFGNYYYFTVAATSGAAASPAVASSIVQYLPNPYSLTLSVTSSAATFSWSYTGTSPTFYYTLYQTTVNAYTGGTQTTIVSSNTTSSSVTYNFTSVSNNYYFFNIYQVTSYGTSATYQSPLVQYVPFGYTVTNGILGLDYTVTTAASFTYIAFLNSAKTMSLITAAPATISYAVVGGGGSGGDASGGGSGGGGAGAIQSNASYSLTNGTYSITVGTGGGYSNSPSSGSNSVFGSITAPGGSAGGNGGANTGGTSGTPPGNSGGTGYSSGNYGVAGGGGGLGGTGGAATSTQAGSGGTGVALTFGSTYNVGGGGGGGAMAAVGTNAGSATFGGGAGENGTYRIGKFATLNTGGGGGGGGMGGGYSYASQGGSGIILLSFPGALLPAPPNPNITFSNSSGNIYTIATAWTAVSGATGYSYSLVNTTTSATLASGTTTSTTFSLASQTIGTDTFRLTVNAYNSNGNGVPATTSAFHSVSPSITVGNATLGTDYTTSNVGGVPYYAFLATGKTMTITTSAATTISCVAIGGGGAGGGNNGGAGGAGGLAQTWNYPLAAGTYNITIGAGGVGINTTALASNGANTVFGSILTAYGGGGGNWIGYQGTGGVGQGGVGAVGGCGGASRPISSPFYVIGGSGIQGGNGGAYLNPSAGGYVGPGGGGIGGHGGDATTTTGAGGVGLAFVFGSTTYNLGGGGGGWGSGAGTFGGGTGAPGPYGNGSNGTANTGGGGGAGGANSGNGVCYGGNGGSGIVLLTFN